MYVIVKILENNETSHFSMLASNGTYIDDNLLKAVIFPSVQAATKEKEVLTELNPDSTFAVKQIVLQDV